MSAIVIILYALNMFIFNEQLGDESIVETSVAILSAVTLVLSIILYAITPTKLVTYGSLIVYTFLVMSIGYLVVSTNGIHSPFIALWMAISVFSGIFGLPIIILMLVIINGYIIYGYIDTDLLGSDIIFAVLVGELPVIVSYIIWYGHEESIEEQDTNVSSLNKELATESSKYNAIIKAIGDGVIVVSPTGALSLINPAAQQMVGWSNTDSKGLSYDLVFKLLDKNGEELKEKNNPIVRVLNTNQQIRDSDISILSKSGKNIPIAMVITPIGDGGEGAIAVFRDITKEKKEGREQAEFISTASHEMRTPVASIEGYLGLALNPNTATIDDKARDFISKAHESSQHLGQLFQDLLDVTKAEDGRLRSTPRVIDIIDFTKNIVDGLKIKATDKGLDIKYLPDGTKSKTGDTVIAPILFSRVDKDHLREVLDNLVENAIKYTPKGQVVVDVTGSEDKIIVSIKDSGIGIPTEDLNHLFQKFYRVDNSDTREIGGTGLGLYLCRRLVESMNGKIWAESEYQKGSTFFVELPRLSRDEAERLKESDQLDDERRKEKENLQSKESKSTPSSEIEKPTLDTQTNAPIQQETPSIQPSSTTIASNQKNNVGTQAQASSVSTNNIASNNTPQPTQAAPQTTNTPTAAPQQTQASNPVPTVAPQAPNRN